MNKKILITGGAGFIGSHLVARLSETYDRIVVIDNLNTQIHGEEQDSYTYKSILGKCTFIKGDVLNRADWLKELDETDTIIHLAAETGTGQSMYESERYVSVNCTGTAILCDILSAGNHSVKKVVVASSRAIYGEGKLLCPQHGFKYPDSRLSENMEKGIFENLCDECGAPLLPVATDESSRINPLSIYGLTKYFQENALLSVCQSLNIDCTALRFQNVYGPGQSLKNPYTGIISIFSNRLRLQKDIQIFEDGEESRDFVYITDVINSIMLSISKNEISQRAYNIGSGIQTSVKEVAYQLKDLLKSNSGIKISGQFRKGDIRHNFADNSLAQKELGYESKVSFKEGLGLFVNWAMSETLSEDKYEKSLNELKDKGLLNTKK
jgi:dTDP-L-rhamnose 4-epimerase